MPPARQRAAILAASGHMRAGRRQRTSREDGINHKQINAASDAWFANRGISAASFHDRAPRTVAVKEHLAAD